MPRPPPLTTTQSKGKQSKKGVGDWQSELWGHSDAVTVSCGNERGERGSGTADLLVNSRPYPHLWLQAVDMTERIRLQIQAMEISFPRVSRLSLTESCLVGA